MNFIDSLFDWLLYASLRASALALVVIFLQIILERWLPAKWRYALWLPVVFVLVAPILPATSWSMENKLISNGVIVTAVPLQSEAPTRANGKMAATGLSGPTNEVAGQRYVREFLLALWFCGASGVLSAGLIGYRRTLRRIGRNSVKVESSLSHTVSGCAKQIGLRRIPRIVLSTAVDSPAISGLIRPMLLLPANFPMGFTSAEAKLVLLHELTHLKRLDLPLNWLLCVLQAIHWFNPLMWFAFGRIRTDREAACDAQVLSADAQDHRADYGHALLKLQGPSIHSVFSLAFVGIFERSGMHFRIRAITRSRHIHPAWSVLAVTMIFLLTLLGATRAQQKDDAPASSSEAAAAQVLIGVEGRFVEIQGGMPFTITSDEIKSENETWIFKQSPQSAEALFKDLEKQGGKVLGTLVETTQAGERASIAMGGGKGEMPRVYMNVLPTIKNQAITLATGLFVSASDNPEKLEGKDVMGVAEKNTSTLQDKQTLVISYLPNPDKKQNRLFVFITAHVVNRDTAREFQTDLCSRKFVDVPPGFFNGATTSGDTAPTSGLDVKQQLIDRGIKFPSGATATFFPESRMISVVDTEPQQQKLELLIKAFRLDTTQRQPISK